MRLYKGLKSVGQGFSLAPSHVISKPKGLLYNKEADMQTRRFAIHEKTFLLTLSTFYLEDTNTIKLLWPL